MNNSGATRSCSVGDKLSESTGDKLPTGEIDSTLLGRLFGLYWGVAPLGCLYSAGEQSYIKTAGDACLGTSVYSAGEY